MISRRTAKINDTRIKYLLVAGSKLYEVTDINFSDLTIEARKTGLDVSDVPEGELWDISDLGEFKVRLVNGGGMGEVIDFEEWREKRGDRKS